MARTLVFAAFALMRTHGIESALSFKGVNARDGFLSAIGLMQQSARLMGMFMPDRGLFFDWPELDNKIEAFRLFQSVDRELHFARAWLKRALSRDA